MNATFTATTASNVRTSSCVGSDGGTYASARGEYTGTAIGSDATLTGPITIDAESLINTTTGVGTVNGTLRIAVSGGGQTTARFDAIFSNGSVTGLAEGNGSSFSRLIANFASDYNAAGGFGNGQLGGPTSHGGIAVEVTQGGCQQPKPERIDVHGTVTAVSSTSISAAGVTCAVPGNLQSVVGGIHTGDFVRLECTVSGGTTTLDQVSGDKAHHDDGHHNGFRKVGHHH